MYTHFDFLTHWILSVCVWQQRLILLVGLRTGCARRAAFMPGAGVFRGAVASSRCSSAQ